ncbi:hypothetical protein HPB51_027861 [Rhipicephalus microplus]|uniref:Uncharacterized protein n=1 Tax=Rhipicephalus microplus TaxID=6941 RepID=A0A9J6CYW7_RHIMP|nr:hypothetical protein HPB51_027861 [Rhipicephalus microplus]
MTITYTRLVVCPTWSTDNLTQSHPRIPHWKSCVGLRPTTDSNCPPAKDSRDPPFAHPDEAEESRSKSRSNRVASQRPAICPGPRFKAGLASNPGLTRVPLLLLRRITASIENARSFPIYAELYKKALQSKPVGKEPFNEPVRDDLRVLQSGRTFQRPAAPHPVAKASDLATAGTETSALPAGVLAKPQGDSTDLASQTASLPRDAVHAPSDFASGTIPGATSVPSPEDGRNF